MQLRGSTTCETATTETTEQWRATLGVAHMYHVGSSALSTCRMFEFDPKEHAQLFGHTCSPSA